MNKRMAPHSTVPSSGFKIDAHLHPNNKRPGSFNVPGGYFLDSNLHEFDPGLFNIFPVEAMWMDPQQRKLLEVVYETFESAGVGLAEMKNSKTGVFVGSFTSDFQQISFKEPDFRHSYAATGVDPGIILARINHVFNLHWPSLTINTTCSSSVYALRQSFNALRYKECSGAISAGTNLMLSVDHHMNTAKLGILSPDSSCRTFDASANGYGRAEAVGAVYLKRLSDAIQDGDPNRAVVRSSAMNSNGKLPNVGITHPNLEGQVQVIRHRINAVATLIRVERDTSNIMARGLLLETFSRSTPSRRPCMQKASRKLSLFGSAGSNRVLATVKQPVGLRHLSRRCWSWRIGYSLPFET